MDKPEYCPQCGYDIEVEEYASFYCKRGCGWWIQQIDWNPEVQRDLVKRFLQHQYDKIELLDNKIELLERCLNENTNMDC